MTAHYVLLISGVVLLAASVILAALTLRCYVLLDIRGVRDDLSGKARQRRLEGLRPSRTPSKGPRPSAQRVSKELPTEVATLDESPTVVVSNEDSDRSFVVTHKQVSLGTSQTIWD